MVRSGWLYALVSVCAALAGCGTTRWTDTKRTATEQMLISDAVDRAISQMNFSTLSGQDVFLDTQHLDEAVDKHYVISTLRQHMVASGCVLKEKRDDATYVVEARAAAIGTNRQDLLWGVPSMSLPATPVPGVPSAIPEIALAKRTGQEAVAKLAVFAYERSTGRPVWQSGAERIASKADDLWMFGAGPFQRGSIYEDTRFAGNKLPSITSKPNHKEKSVAAVNQEAVFSDPRLARRDSSPRIANASSANTPAVTAPTTAMPASVIPATVAPAGPAPAPSTPISLPATGAPGTADWSY